jgi:hypothetical protein
MKQVLSKGSFTIIFPEQAEEFTAILERHPHEFKIYSNSGQKSIHTPAK